ncbi:MAG: hypothetical protein FWE21_07160 [Defluviitaleaceae bacterium]|nr:hypothetical protein [Defluviitaleaceae bacterium]
MDTTLAIISVIATATGALVALTSALIILPRRSRIDIVKSLYEMDKEPALIEARRIVHGLPDAYDGEEMQKKHGYDLAVLIISYEMVGYLVKKRHLPFSILSKTQAGISILKLYRKLTPYIEYRQKSNKNYAIYFSRLVKKLSNAGVVEAATDLQDNAHNLEGQQE